MARILIITPFRNEDHSIPQYLESINSIDYPKKLIDVYWLENDSSDKTLKMLKAAKSKQPFRTVRLKSIKILGPIKKRPFSSPPRSTQKDIAHGPKRVHSWLVIWNKYFTPLIRKSKADYVLMWYADGVAKPNIIKKYLKVFKNFKDAGWVSGAMYSKYPRHKHLGCPIPLDTKTNKPRLPCPIGSKKPVKVKYNGHLWMCPRKPLAKCMFARIGRDMHMSLILGLKKQGLYVYHDPTVFIKHVSTDGKIYTHKLRKESMRETY